MVDLGGFAQQIPSYDGAMRRRLFSGLLIGVCYLEFAPEPLSIWGEDSASELLKSWIAGIFFVLAALAIGAIVDIFADVFVVGLCGAVCWAAVAPKNAIMPKSKAAYYTAFLFHYTFSILPLIVSAIVAAALGMRRFPMNIPVNGDSLPFNRESRSRADMELPSVIEYGLRHPFCEYFEMSWRHLANKLEEKERRFVFNRFSGCADLVTLAAAIIISVLIALPSGRVMSNISTSLYVSDVFPIASVRYKVDVGDLGDVGPEGEPKELIIDGRVIVIPVLLVLVLAMFSMFYYIALRAAVHNCVELYKITLQTKD